MARKQDVEEPTLGAAWTMLGERLGLTVDERASRSIRAQGSVRGRTVTVEIDGSGGKREFGRFFFGLNTISHELLMSIMADVQIHVLPNEIRIDDHSTAIPDKGANYVAGSLIHHFQGSPPPMPERAIAGPPWWIDLMCDLADALDR